jgi:hypothetical protein
MIKWLNKLLITLFGFGILGLVAWQGMKHYLTIEKKTEEQSVVLLEKIEEVCKLITVEGYFSEMYDYKDYYLYDIGFLRKKALIRVKAKVSVGYNLSDIQIKADNSLKRILLSEFPKPEILSIDHDLDYYDISEGTFNNFSSEDYTELSKRAKRFIEQKALESELVRKAEFQKNEIMDLIRFLVNNAGWELNLEKSSTYPSKIPRLPDLKD